jgi:hypothetical protein
MRFLLGLAMGLCLTAAAQDIGTAARYVRDASGMTKLGVLAAGLTDDTGATVLIKVDAHGRVVCSP